MLCPQPASQLLVLLAMERYLKVMSCMGGGTSISPLPCGPPSWRETQLMQQRCSHHQTVNKEQHLAPNRVSCLVGQWEKFRYSSRARRVEGARGLLCLQGWEVGQRQRE